MIIVIIRVLYLEKHMFLNVFSLLSFTLDRSRGEIKSSIMEHVVW